MSNALKKQRRRKNAKEQRRLRSLHANPSGGPSASGFHKTDKPKHGAKLKAKQQIISAADLADQIAGPLKLSDVVEMTPPYEAKGGFKDISKVPEFAPGSKPAEPFASVAEFHAERDLALEDVVSGGEMILPANREMTEEEAEDIRKRAATKKKSFKKLAQQEGWEFIDPNDKRMRDADNWQRPA